MGEAVALAHSKLENLDKQSIERHKTCLENL